LKALALRTKDLQKIKRGGDWGGVTAVIERATAMKSKKDEYFTFSVSISEW
jgi:hypothetical protein